MFISLELIARELRTIPDLEVILSHASQCSAMTLSGMLPIELADELQNDLLYCINPRDSFPLNTSLAEQIQEASAPILLVGDSVFSDLSVPSIVCRPKKSHPQDSALSLQDAPSLETAALEDSVLYERYREIYRCILCTFQKYAHWEEELLTALQKESLQMMFDVSYPIFGVTLSLIDSEFKWLFLSGPKFPFFSGLGNSMPIEYISLIKNDAYGTEIHQKKTAFISPDPHHYYESEGLCFNLFLLNSYFGRIVAMSVDEPHTFTASDLALMNVLGKHVQILINHTYVTKKNPSDETGFLSSALYQQLKSLLKKKPIHPLYLKHTLLSCGWQPEEYYYIGYLALNQTKVPSKNNLYYCRHIMQTFQGVYAIYEESYLVLFFQSSRYAKASDCLQAFSEYIRENNFRLGISNLCRNLNDLYYYFRQAELALTFGLQQNGMIWRHQFSDYVLDYLIQPNHEIPSKFLCAEELHILKEYDEKNHTDYCQTLLTYLENQMNAVQTAKKLYIHHATMVFRIKRLKELTHIDFTDMGKLVHIYLSYKMLSDDRYS